MQSTTRLHTNAHERCNRALYLAIQIHLAQARLIMAKQYKKAEAEEEQVKEVNDVEEQVEEAEEQAREVKEVVGRRRRRRRDKKVTTAGLIS